MFAILEYYVGWEIVVCFALLLVYMFRIYTTTTALLFDNGSICNYWREELGGKPDADDPYDLSVVVERIHKRAKLSKHEHFNEKFRRSSSFTADGGKAPVGSPLGPLRTRTEGSLRKEGSSSAVDTLQTSAKKRARKVASPPRGLSLCVCERERDGERQREMERDRGGERERERKREGQSFGRETRTPG
ncbi:hypothetical protein T484DRAFT_2981620 [Baffinella frigidus]|nr:hypothetical protein T484DRAFT_2981620 [Cryptophyta sp. CCMP2293]